MTKPLTMKDIARLAQVSQPTVSRVINGNKDVNEELAKRVLKVIDEVGFIPNKTARALKQQQSKLIGISIAEIYNPYFVELIEQIESVTRQHGYNIILHNAKHNPMMEWENIQNFLMRQVDGCIVVPTGHYNVERLANLSIPVVAITQYVEELDSVSLDHRQAGRQVAKSFIQKGHQSFGYIGTRQDEKYLGYEAELYENGFAFNAANNFVEITSSTSDHLAIQRALEQYMTQQGSFPFTAIFAENDIIAFELKRFADERGISVPSELSIIGFDDTSFAKLLGLSSVQQPVTEMVQATIKLLLERINHKAAGEFVHIQLQPYLIERESSKKV